MRTALVLVITIALCSTLLYSQVPTIISHNGFLADTSGTPLTTTVALTMRLFTDSLAGSEIWHQVFPSVAVENGVYHVNLDVSGVDFNQQYWLQTEVGISVLAPRTRITSTPYSLALHLPYRGTVASSSNAMTLVNSGIGKGLDARSAGIGVYGGSTGNSGVEGVSTTGYGVKGISKDANGVYGTSTVDAGVSGSSDSVAGVYGWSLVDAGIYGTNAGSDNFGYLGGPLYGTYGKNQVTGNYGYLGGGSNAIGAYNAGSGAGVRGECVNGFGIYGINGTTGNYGMLGTGTYGVYGKALSAGGFAGYFDGQVAANILQINGGSDLAEPFESDNEETEPAPGTVVVLDENVPGKIGVSSTPYDSKVAGVVSGAGGIHPGITLQQNGTTNGKTLVAIAGRVYCKASAINGPIKTGDLLTTSSLPGYAMRVSDHNAAQGAIIGKAVSSLSSGEGLVLVLVTLH